MKEKFLAPSSIWMPFHMWFPKDEAIHCLVPPNRNRAYPELKVNTDMLKSIERTDLSPTITTGAKDLALVMHVNPIGGRAVVYNFNLN
jgi:hypothetical protein